MSDSVVVGVRVRPLNARECAGGEGTGWKVESNAITKKSSPDKRRPTSFCYDSVFAQHSTNEEVYESLAAPIVDAALGGFNATVFAYGQTSSGKTHSMLGNGEDPGVTPLAIRHVLRTTSACKTRQYLIRAAYVEIYNDKIRDLLNPQSGDLAVREDKAGRVFVDAEEVIVESFEDAMGVMERGQAARQVGETKMNARSSRSHTIFTLQIESKGGEGVDQSFRASSLNLVDLAGSERLKSTGAEGARQKEGAHINKSLLVLGTIINRLSSAAGDASKIGHLPYRDSKLTRLLRPALGGNAKTAIMCAVTPAAAHMEETMSTLKFAERAKKVTNNATRNEVVDYRSKYKEAATELALLREKCVSMEAELACVRGNGDDRKMRSASANSSFTDMSTSTASQVELSGTRLSAGQDAANIISMSVELHASREEVTYLKEHVDEVETENDHLREQLRKRASEFRGLRSRALELRSSARKARHSERTVRRAMASSFQKLEEARAQLDVSRKKGAHVRLAEVHLEELSESLKAWLPAGSGVVEDRVSTESITPPASEAQDEGYRHRRASSCTVSDLSILTDAKGTAHARFSSVDAGESLTEGNTVNGKRPVHAVRRRPRPLPEDMVADIDDSEAETDRQSTVPLDDNDGDDDLENDEEFAAPMTDVNRRISDDSRDTMTLEKPNKKPKGWKAFKNFYGYGYTERGVYDKMIQGHRVPSTATHISS